MVRRTTGAFFLRPWPRRGYGCGCRRRCGRRLVRVRVQAQAQVRPWSRLRTQVRATLGEDAFCAGAGKAGCGNTIEGPPPFRHASLSGFRREHLPSGAKLHFCSRHCVVGALYWAQRAACWQRLVGRRRVFATLLQVKVGLRFRAGRGRGLRRTRRMR